MPRNKSTTAGAAKTKAAPVATRRTSPASRSGSDKSGDPKARTTGRPAEQASASLVELAARRDEVIASLAAADERLGDLRGQLEQITGEIELARKQAEAVRGEAAEASAAFGEVSHMLATARVDVEAVRRSVAEAAADSREAVQRSELVKADVARTRAELAALGGWTPVAPGEAPAPAPALTEPAGEELPEIPTLPDAEQSAARERLLRYLNDAWATEKEQADLLQTLAQAAGGAELRALLEEHRATSERQQASVGARIVARGSAPSGGPGLVGQLAARIWDALRKPKGTTDEEIHVLLKALAAAEFEAALYLAVRALACGVGEAEVAELATLHYRQERNFADRLRGRIAPTATGVPTAESRA
jgi:ferritin-like metal-binding protein YciE